MRYSEFHILQIYLAESLFQILLHGLIMQFDIDDVFFVCHIDDVIKFIFRFGLLKILNIKSQGYL